MALDENMVIPGHVALILDGNGRWAKKRGLPPVSYTHLRNEEISGMGLFIEEISSRLSNMDITIPMIGLKGNDNIIERLQQLL